jgi:hypothetical protein
MKSVIAHLVLLLAGVAFAWVIWTRETTEEAAPAATDEDEETDIFAYSPDALQEVSFVSDRRTVKVTARGSASDRWFDVSTYRKDERRRPPPRRDADGGPADGGARDGGAVDGGRVDAGTVDGGAAPEVDVVETRKRFTGNKALADHWKKLAPLRAKRSFGRVRAGTLEEFELDHPRGTITLRVRGKTHTLEVGGTPFGSSDAYVRDKQSGRVYLVAAGTVRDIEFAESRFMQRDLIGAEAKDLTKVVVAVGERKRTLVQRTAGEGQTNWTDEAHPEQRNEMYDNWMRRTLGLRAIEYLAPDEEPHATSGSAATATVFTIEYFTASGSLGRAEIRKVDADDPEYFARTGATRGWVTLSASLLEQVERDLDSLVQ